MSETIATLTEQGYLDDSRFARLFTEDKRQLEQWGSDRIRRSLRERGLDSELIETALGEQTIGVRARAGAGAAAPALLCRRRRIVRERDRALGTAAAQGL